MSRTVFAALFFLFCSILPASGQEPFEKDVISTSGGELEITFLGHGTLMFAYDGKIIHVDPFSKVADFSRLPQADIIFLTHHHRDHLDPAALEQVRTEKTIVMLTEIGARSVKNGVIMKNGDVLDIEDIGVEAVPAYNLIHKRETGEVFHAKGEGNGYVMTFGDKRVYVAGDTENTPEMKELKNIDYAFLPMNLPYTMTPEMVADAAKSFRPKVLYPYHYGETETARIIELLKNIPEVEVRIRRMK
ncbi:MAG: MBL fold metallo-hydrolase [Deltaproteobacteria bacterium]|jgi:L-ascorbate metabolism protein UlaG (beta-lactamase superfamily)|nr:MBL fold metallo-hydrolase [Deltaproteobacteria bacterium]